VSTPGKRTLTDDGPPPSAAPERSLSPSASHTNRQPESLSSSQADVTQSPEMLDAMGLDAEAAAVRADEAGRSWLDVLVPYGDPRSSLDDDSDTSTIANAADEVVDPYALGYDAGLAHELPAACIVDTPTIAADAVSGVHFWVQFDKAKYAQVDQAPPSYQFGPGRAGPYKFNPYTRRGELLFFIAYNTEREQREWVLGPDSVWNFAENVELYVGAATAALPGSQLVGSSTNDGADRATPIPSVLEESRFGHAPWQRPDVAAQMIGVPVALETAASFLGLPTSLDEVSGSVLNPLTWPGRAIESAKETNGGGNLLAARDAHIRLNEYVAPAASMAEQLAARVASGEMGHLEARAAAVSSRNQLLGHTREQMTPASVALSKAMKEEGPSVTEMTDRKVRQSIDAWNGVDKRSKPLAPEKVAKVRADLAADSELWELYAKAVEASGGADEAYKAAVREVGSSPAVSRAIINSAGAPAGSITLLARFSRVGNGALAAIGAADMAYSIISADEGERWHVAAGELQAFAGGVVGAQVGSAAAVWVASLVTTSTGVLLVVSIIGGAIGAAAGAKYVDPVTKLFAAEMSDAYMAMNPVTTGITGGGFGGMYDRERRSNMNPLSFAESIESAIFSMDEAVHELETKIETAPSRDELETLQAARLDLLQRRERAESMLTAVRLGFVDEHGNPGGGLDAQGE